MAYAKDVSFTLKAMVNKQKTRVLFAEFDRDFADLLFSFLILPLGNVVQVLEKHYTYNRPVIGSLNTLYNGLASLDTFLSEIEGTLPSILNPASAYAFPSLKREYRCNSSTSGGNYVLGEAYFMVFRIFSEEKTSFTISDDLRIVPNSKGSILETLSSIGVGMADMDGAESRNITFGLNKIMDFLKALLISRQPLSDTILGTGRINSTAVKSEPGSSVSQTQFATVKSEFSYVQEEPTSNLKTGFNLKVMFQKSTKKFLFAQAEEDFVYFLFHMLLTIPLGLVDYYLGSDTSLNNIGTLYRSMADLINYKHLNGIDAKIRLMKSETFSSSQLSRIVNKGFNGEGSKFMYMVADDLTVTRLSLFTTLSVLDRMKVSSSDVEELEFHVMLEEARSIL
ncbi:hypothetical protein ACS0TY_030958 [Phlomoides rotata]